MRAHVFAYVHMFMYADVLRMVKSSLGELPIVEKEMAKLAGDDDDGQAQGIDVKEKPKVSAAFYCGIPVQCADASNTRGRRHIRVAVGAVRVDTRHRRQESETVAVRRSTGVASLPAQWRLHCGVGAGISAAQTVHALFATER